MTAYHRVTGVAAVGFLAGAVVGALWNYSWLALLGLAFFCAAMFAIAMVVQLLIERWRHQRFWTREIELNPRLARELLVSNRTTQSKGHAWHS